MKLITCMHTQSRCYGVKRQPAKPVGIIVHSTGANNSSIKRYSQPSDNDPKRGELLKLLGTNTYGNHWNRADVSKAVHYVIGKLADGSVATVQNLPEDIACWGAGSGSKGSYNYDPVAHIQFEICEDNLTNADYFRSAVLKEAVELCADICHRHGWDASVIVSHKEAHAKGYGSNHADIDHWLKNFKRTMKDFRAEVQKLLDEMKVKPTPEKITLYSVTANDLDKETADAMIAELTGKGFSPIVNSYEVEVPKHEAPEKVPEEPVPEMFKPYKAKVNTKSGVKIRSGAGTNYAKVGAIKNGTVVTVVEESAGTGAKLWGKLSDGKGWIALDYCEKL